MSPEAKHALASGATVVASSAALARRLRGEFGRLRLAEGVKVWPTPQVLSWESLLRMLWEQALYAGRTHSWRLLSDEQERSVWEQIVEQPDDSPLLNVPATASAASAAWSLALQFRLPLQSGAFRAHNDSDSFLRWANEYRQQMRDSGWIEPAKLADRIAEVAAPGTPLLPSPVYYAGFDALTPQQKWFLHEILRASPLPWPSHRAEVRRLVAPTLEAEFDAVARWARGILDWNPEASIGIVVPDLAASAAALERALRSALHPKPFLDGTPAFHVSLGQPLAEWPVIHAALLLIQLAVEGIDVRQAGVLLRSPFFAGAASESAERAAVDASLRRQPEIDVNLAKLCAVSARCRLLGARLRAVQTLAAWQPPAQKTASAWAAEFSRILDAAGWAQEAGRDSAGYQAVAAWRELLAAFASLDLTLPGMSAPQAFDRLSRMARARRFQTEDPGAPVHGMSPAEAAGAEFDHVWITGLDDTQFPAPARPNPFLPISLQREHGLPHSSPDQELAFARAVLDRLVRCSPNVNLSYAATDGDEERSGSPLVSGEWRPVERTESAAPAAWLEELFETNAPEVEARSLQRGGAELLKNMAACPFRAFAIARLGARELEDPEGGISPSDRGNIVHQAMERFWLQVRTRDALVMLMGEPDRLSQTVDDCVRAAMAKLAGHPLYEVELTRTSRLLVQWLALEAARPPFEVEQLEQKLPVDIGGLALEIRVDRIDRLENGKLAVIDYKTGEVEKKPWESDRPKEPQLPLYCVANAAELEAAVFAQIRAGMLEFKGAAESGGWPEFKQFKLETDSLAAEVGLWQARLERLARRFASGEAAVDPLPNACRYCRLGSLCRVAETAAAGEEEEAADAAG